jgi:SAM-dependent methyltransferase
MTQTPHSHYTFGDTALASSRLELLADAYEPHSRAFLDQVLPAALTLAIDMGSGLGHTTELIRTLRNPKSTVGYERSSRHLAIARSRFPALTFQEQDVMHPPFPQQDADLVYGRFLLTHLDAPNRAIELWSELLGPEGLLVLEEIAHLASCVEEFQEYYAIVACMQAHYGQELYIGRKLDGLARRSRLTVVHSRQTPFMQPAATMARLHAMNIATWKQDPFVRQTYRIEELDRLQSRMEQLAKAGSRVPPVTCTMAQVVLKR